MTFNNKTIEELHNLLVSKEISATELTQATLEDIKAREEAINAFVTIDEDQALAQAKAIDETGIDADKAFTCFLMKATKGQANPQVALKLLAQELAKLKEE